jgi:hypothetical protein
MSHAEIIGVDDEEAGARGIAQPLLNSDRRPRGCCECSQTQYKNADNEVSGFARAGRPCAFIASANHSPILRLQFG